MHNGELRDIKYSIALCCRAQTCACAIFPFNIFKGDIYANKWQIPLQFCYEIVVQNQQTLSNIFLKKCLNTKSKCFPFVHLITKYCGKCPYYRVRRVRTKITAKGATIIFSIALRAKTHCIGLSKSLYTIQGHQN